MGYGYVLLVCANGVSGVDAINLKPSVTGTFEEL